MSATDTRERRLSGPLIGGLAALVLLAIVVIAVVATNDEPVPRREPDRLLPSGDEAPAIEQARWDIRSFPAGAAGRITAKDRRGVREQGERIARLVRRLYDALFLSPSRRQDVLEAGFTRRAARALERMKRVGLPQRAGRVKTLRRDARIGVDALNPRRAVATVSLRAKGVVGDKPFRVRHHAVLWLEKSNGRWSVIAFESDQRRIA